MIEFKGQSQSSFKRQSSLDQGFYTSYKQAKIPARAWFLAALVVVSWLSMFYVLAAMGF